MAPRDEHRLRSPRPAPAAGGRGDGRRDPGLPRFVAWPLLAAAVALAAAVSGGLLPPRLQHASSPPVDTFQGAMARGYDDGVLLAWVRHPDRLAEFIDLDAARAFALRKLTRHPVNEVDLVCAGYHLGLPPADLARAARDPSWRYFWRYDPWIFCSYYLALGSEPTEDELNRFLFENTATARRLSHVEALEDIGSRYTLARALIALKLLRQPIPADVAGAVRRWSDDLAGRADPDRGLPDRYVDLFLGQMAGIEGDHGELLRFIEGGWDGTSYPDEGCGSENCATKFLLESLRARFFLDLPPDRDLATEQMAYLVALVNDDGSLRVGLDDPRTVDVTDTVEMHHCTTFCQLNHFRYFNAMSYLVDVADPDPEQVRELAERRRAERSW